MRPGRGVYERCGDAVILDEALYPNDCARLVAQFDRQPVHPVGVSGYAQAEGEAGSHRAYAWGVELAGLVSEALKVMPSRLDGDGRDLVGRDIQIAAPFRVSGPYRRLGSTPWLRFMRYAHGGRHTPHYDAPFRSPVESFVTLFSWVLFLNDVAEHERGRFQFVDDGWELHPQERPSDAFQDWPEMADEGQVRLSVQPRSGRLLVFPHWLCHQVETYAGERGRYIVRGDLAYASEAGSA